MFAILFIFSLRELVTFDRAQNRSLSEVCTYDKYYEKSIFEFESSFNAPDDSDDGIDISGIVLTPEDKSSCNYNVHVSQQLKDRTLAFFNRIRWLTGYQRKLTWDDSKDNETCQCSFVRWAAGSQIANDNHNGQCTKHASKWKEGCKNSNQISFDHRKMSNGIYALYDEGFLDVEKRNLMLSPNLTKTSMCTVSYGKQNNNFPPTDYFTMNFQFNENNEEELPFIASPPPGFIPYYMMPSVASLLAKDIRNPKESEFKVYCNGSLISGYSATQSSSHEKYHGYTFEVARTINRNYSHLIGDFVENAIDLFFPPGSVFRFEATNNGKTYAWNTTLVDCAQYASKYPDPTITIESSNPDPKFTPKSSDPKSRPTPNADTATKSMDCIDKTSSQKSGLSQKQKIGIGVGVTVGVAAVAGAVVGGLAFAGVFGGDSSVVASGAAGTSALAA